MKNNKAFQRIRKLFTDNQIKELNEMSLRARLVTTDDRDVGEAFLKNVLQRLRDERFIRLKQSFTIDITTRHPGLIVEDCGEYLTIRGLE